MIRAGLLLAALLAGPAAAQSVEAVLAQAKSDCASMDNGVFAAPPAATVQVDVTGDGKPETMVDSSQFQCSTSASYWGGSGGNWLALIVEGQQIDFLAQGWQVVTWNKVPVLMLWLGGFECGGFGVDPCVEALVWSEDKKTFMTVRSGGNDADTTGSSE